MPDDCEWDAVLTRQRLCQSGSAPSSSWGRIWLQKTLILVKKLWERVTPLGGGLSLRLFWPANQKEEKERGRYKIRREGEVEEDTNSLLQGRRREVFDVGTQRHVEVSLSRRKAATGANVYTSAKNRNGLLMKTRSHSHTQPYRQKQFYTTETARRTRKQWVFAASSSQNRLNCGEN